MTDLNSLPPALQDLITQKKPWPLGVDIGWSTDRESMALASTIDVFGPFNLPATCLHAVNGPSIFTCEQRFADVLAWASRLPEGLRKLAVPAVDGPIGPAGVPAVQRYIDRACQSGQCQNRCVPASVVGGGRLLVQATYQFVDALFQGVQYTVLCRPVAQATETGAQLLEVNPPIGLAWLVPCVQNWRDLPSRKRQVAWNGRTFKCKSDYYWARGANQHVAQALGCLPVVHVQHHERECSLYALAVAACFVGNQHGQVLTVGAGTGPYAGVYHVLGPIHSDWQAEQQRIGFRA
jgi:hypothetical protein